MIWIAAALAWTAPATGRVPEPVQPGGRDAWLGVDMGESGAHRVGTYWYRSKIEIVCHRGELVGDVFTAGPLKGPLSVVLPKGVAKFETTPWASQGFQRLDSRKIQALAKALLTVDSVRIRFQVKGEAPTDVALALDDRSGLRAEMTRCGIEVE